MNRQEQIKVFFDESGKRKTKPNLMAGLSIPAKIYALPEIETYSQQLRDGTIKFHWNEVTGESTQQENIKNVLKVISQFHDMIKFNVIHYDYSVLANRTEFDKDMIDRMIYTKFPERIIYGLLRGYGRTIDISTEIYIENSTEYQAFELHDLIKRQLNIQSLYRGEHYAVTSSQLVPKGQEIGVEVTDLLLGIIRTIIDNKPGTSSKAYGIKNAVIIELLKVEDFFNLLNNIRFFEWTNARELREISFSDYIRLFIADNYDQWKL